MVKAEELEDRSALVATQKAEDHGLEVNIGASANISLKKKFAYPGAPRKWPAFVPIQSNQMISAPISEDSLYSTTEDSVYTYGPDSLRAHLPVDHEKHNVH